MADWNFEQQCGSSTPFEVDITDANDAPIDISAGSAEWIFATLDEHGNPTVPILRYASDEGGKLTLGADGKITGILHASDTATIAKGVKRIVAHQMFLTLPNGEPMRVQAGKVTFIPKLPVE